MPETQPTTQANNFSIILATSHDKGGKRDPYGVVCRVPLCRLVRMQGVPLYRFVLDPLFDFCSVSVSLPVSLSVCLSVCLSLSHTHTHSHFYRQDTHVNSIRILPLISHSYVKLKAQTYHWLRTASADLFPPSPPSLPRSAVFLLVT